MNYRNSTERKDFTMFIIQNSFDFGLVTITN